MTKFKSELIYFPQLSIPQEILRLAGFARQTHKVKTTPHGAAFENFGWLTVLKHYGLLWSLSAMVQQGNGSYLDSCGSIKRRSLGRHCCP